MTAGGRWPRVLPCRWCGAPVLRDNHGDWIHHHLAYVCRDRAGNALPTSAEPDVTRR
jgi:hypothetical protein